MRFGIYVESLPNRATVFQLRDYELKIARSEDNFETVIVANRFWYSGISSQVEPKSKVQQRYLGGLKAEDFYTDTSSAMPWWDVASRALPNFKDGEIYQLAFGLPIRWYVFANTSSGPVEYSGPGVVHVHELSSLAEYLGAQGHILWPRLIANVFLWTVPIFLVLRCVPVARAVIAWRRKRRGQCIACGYDLAGLAKCSECGMEKPPSTTLTPYQTTTRSS